MLIARILAGLVGIALTYQSVWYFLAQTRGWDPIAVAVGAVMLLIGLFALWFVLLGGDEAERSRMGRTLLIGLGLGFICFLAGFVGPIIFMPQSNQGPLLGIFITGRRDSCSAAWRDLSGRGCGDERGVHWEGCASSHHAHGACHQDSAA